LVRSQPPFTNGKKLLPPRSVRRRRPSSSQPTGTGEKVQRDAKGRAQKGYNTQNQSGPSEILLRSRGGSGRQTCPSSKRSHRRSRRKNSNLGFSGAGRGKKISSGRYSGDRFKKESGRQKKDVKSAERGLKNITSPESQVVSYRLKQAFAFGGKTAKKGKLRMKPPVQAREEEGGRDLTPLRLGKKPPGQAALLRENGA